MNTPARLGAYAAGVAVLTAGAYGIGAAVGPVTADEPTSSSSSSAGHDSGAAADTSRTTEEVDMPGGLQISQDGYTLDPLAAPAAPDAEGTFSFHVLGPDGDPVTDFAPTHDKPLHLIVVRRDLTGFQHVHPTMAADGTWSIPLTFPAAGTYRAYADFLPTGAEDGLTLGADVEVAGSYRPESLPPPTRTAQADGYTVTLAGELVPGQASELTLSVAKDGEPVTDLQPYLAAYGHLVALRHGDLAYLHVHPEGAPGDGTTAPGPEIMFSADVPSTGDYRLFLDFQHDGVVRTAEFPASAGDTASARGPAAESHSHEEGE